MASYLCWDSRKTVKQYETVELHHFHVIHNTDYGLIDRAFGG